MFRTLVLQKQKLKLEVLIKAERMLVTALRPRTVKLSHAHTHMFLECSRTLLTLDSPHTPLSTSHLCCVCLLQSSLKSSLKA